MFDTLSEIWATLSHNKLRTSLTGFAVSWGIFMLIALLGAGNGLLNAFMNNRFEVETNSMEIWPGRLSKPYKGMKEGTWISFDSKDVALLKSPEFSDVIFYMPYGMATESEQADWEEHIKKFPEYAKLTKGEYPYFDPPQFFYHHGAIFLDSAAKARLAGGVFYQCGSYCGASLIAMSQYKPSMMYGFEPALSCGMVMQANVRRSGLENVKMYRMCVGDQIGKATVPDQDRDGNPCKAEVPITSLDYFRRGRKETERTAWIQADVGGMSLPVIRGAEQMIRQDKPLITVAMYHNPEEFFGIVPLLHKWVPEYKFMVRRCQCNPRIPYSEITLIAFVP